MRFKKIGFVFVLHLLFISLSAQKPMDDYDKSWKHIDQLLDSSGLLKSALKEIDLLYAKAKKENNNAQIVKALVYRVNVNDRIIENSDVTNIKALEQEASNATQPAKAILHSIIATQYWNYLQANRWKLYSRSNTKGFEKEDLTAWNLDDLHKKISEYFLASLEPAALLKSTPLDQFEPVIIKGNTRKLRPTLFDLLAHEALDYFKTDEQDLTKPAYAFEINDSRAFAEAGIFSAATFATADTSSMHYRALTLFKDLLTFHQQDKDPAPLIDANVERIEFVRLYSTLPEKEDLYKKALEAIATRYPNSSSSAQAWFLLARHYADQAERYQPIGDTANRYAYVKAVEICKNLIQQKDTSEGWTNAFNLLRQIEKPEIHIQAEKVTLPNLPSRVLVAYKNVPAAHFRLVRFDDEIAIGIGENAYTDDYWKKVFALPAIKTFTVSLPATNDYQKHSVEIKLDAMPLGHYALIAASGDDFSAGSNVASINPFQVSNLSYISSGPDFYALHRNTGAPIKGVRVQLWKKSYDQKAGKWTRRRGETYISDQNGYFKVAPRPSKDMNNYGIELSYHDDALFMDNQYYYPVDFPGVTDTDEDETQTFLFTDRSLYRPGQTVYFKGIVIDKQVTDHPAKILARRKSVINLYDANANLIDSLSLVTNEFGSYSGKFTLPPGSLNGQFLIEDDDNESQQRFNVEEYKRPKFLVELTKPIGTYRVNDTITIAGSAKAYSGNGIDGASVRYRIVRKATNRIYNEFYLPRIWPPFQQDQVEITNGTTTTDETGKFQIVFKALADNKLSPKSHPVFTYEVFADVNDINGETRSDQQTVQVGYEALQLAVSVPPIIRKDSFEKVMVSTTSMNGVFERTEVTLKVYSLNAPQKVFRERLWEQPDQFIFSREDYYKSFPNDLYSDEYDMTKWTRGKVIVQLTQRTHPDSVFQFRSLKMPAGVYVIEASAVDKFGESVTTEKYFSLDQDRLESPFAGLFLDVKTSDTLPLVGDKVNYQLTTNLDSLYLLHELSRGVDDLTRTIIAPSKKPALFETMINASDPDDLFINILFVKNNRFYSKTAQISVNRPERKLKIDYTSFRDKTLPGIEERWAVKVSGFGKDKLAAELLTSMYDASLDQYYPQHWTIPDVWSTRGYAPSWTAGENFLAESSRDRFFNLDYRDFDKRYDELLTPRSRQQFASVRGVKSGGRQLEGRVPGVAIAQATDLSEVVVQGYSAKKEARAEVANPAPRPQSPETTQIRKNLSETAFFFPDLHTDTAGNVQFSFTTPEALTTWKWMLLAHTKGLAFGSGEKTMITQKQLMVQPNAPRFLREGDRMDFSTKIVNMTSKEITGNVMLELVDPSNNKTADGIFQNSIAEQFFTVGAGQSVPAQFSITIPYNYHQPVTWRIVARANTKDSISKQDITISDGEEGLLPVISNRKLVTETLPLPVKGNSTQKFTFDKLRKSGESASLEQNRLTVEFTANPAWYAVQALPYLNEVKDPQVEQLFNSIYAKALASSIAGSSDKLRQVFDKWKKDDTSALLSNLQKNEELKAVILDETPWVLDAKTEAAQKKNLALLFDLNQISKDLNTAIEKLQDMQSPDGSFSWFKDGYPDRYMTQYIATGIGHLKHLGALPKGMDQRLNRVSASAVSWLDKQIKKDYEDLRKRDKKMVSTEIAGIPVQYLYMRSFFNDIAVPATIFPAYNFYRNQAKLYWVKQNTYLRGMIALALARTGEKQVAKKIMAALKESAVVDPELGMYWKDMSGGYYWYQAPIESQSVMIEAFSEVSNDKTSVDVLKTWLLKNKQTNSWPTGKATADACYALLLQGSSWLSAQPNVEVSLGSKSLKTNYDSAQAGTGYWKMSLDQSVIKPDMGNITVKVSSKQKDAGPVWGAVYWQYFEDLDKITEARTPLSVTKKLFIERNTDRGPVLEALDPQNNLQVGDKVKVRIELRSDREMEYVHVKDMRAAALEPVTVLSTFHWENGAGYYETTKDASIDYFFQTLPKGTYVFEYTLFVTHSGTFSNGVTTAQCFYAPEFSSHSEGIKLNIAGK